MGSSVISKGLTPNFIEIEGIIYRLSLRNTELVFTGSALQKTDHMLITEHSRENSNTPGRKQQNHDSERRQPACSSPGLKLMNDKTQTSSQHNSVLSKILVFFSRFSKVLYQPTVIRVHIDELPTV